LLEATAEGSDSLPIFGLEGMIVDEDLSWGRAGQVANWRVAAIEATKAVHRMRKLNPPTAV
jgi:hypothetical protein